MLDPLVDVSNDTDSVIFSIKKHCNDKSFSTPSLPIYHALVQGVKFHCNEFIVWSDTFFGVEALLASSPENNNLWHPG